jgi:hypothetical protein
VEVWALIHWLLVDYSSQSGSSPEVEKMIQIEGKSRPFNKTILLN